MVNPLWSHIEVCILPKALYFCGCISALWPQTRRWLGWCAVWASHTLPFNHVYPIMRISFEVHAPEKKNWRLDGRSPHPPWYPQVTCTGCESQNLIKNKFCSRYTMLQMYNVKYWFFLIFLQKSATMLFVPRHVQVFPSWNTLSRLVLSLKQMIMDNR